MTRRAILWASATLLPLLLAAAAPAPTVPAYRTFGHWVVGCDNTRFCEARGFDGSQPVDMRVLRAAGDARTRIVLSAADDRVGGTVRIDGKKLELPAPPWVRSKGDPSDLATLATDDPMAVGNFVVAVRDGHTLQFGDADDSTVPLDGLRAALLFVDAVQGRPGTTLPLLAVAGSSRPPPPSVLPSPPKWHAPYPLTEIETRALIRRAKELPSPPDGPCDRTEDADVYALDASSALAVRQCELYAYQGTALVYILPRKGGGTALPVILPLPGVPKDEENVAGPAMVSPEFDPKTGRLSVMEKARGSGDCGLTAEWGWDAGAFHMISLEFLDQCGEPDPGDFLTLYRSANGG